VCDSNRLALRILIQAQYNPFNFFGAVAAALAPRSHRLRSAKLQVTLRYTGNNRADVRAGTLVRTGLAVLITPIVFVQKWITTLLYHLLTQFFYAKVLYYQIFLMLQILLR
jgi:hypothetical protein